MQTLFITATGTDVGKTYATLKLMRAFAEKGLQTGICKPVETGVKDTPLDAALLLKECQSANSSFLPLSPTDITAYTFSLPAAPFCADSGQTIDPEKIFEKIDELRSLCDLLLIEGAGGLMVPITKEFFMLDLIRELKADTLLVTPSRLGCINETLLSIEALKSRDIDFDWCVNIYEDSDAFPYVTQPFYDARFPEWWSLQHGVENYTKSILSRHRIRKP